jgi:hypothetical protein
MRDKCAAEAITGWVNQPVAAHNLPSDVLGMQIESAFADTLSDVAATFGIPKQKAKLSCMRSKAAVDIQDLTGGPLCARDNDVALIVGHCRKSTSTDRGDQLPHVYCGGRACSHRALQTCRHHVEVYCRRQRQRCSEGFYADGFRGGLLQTISSWRTSGLSTTAYPAFSAARRDAVFDFLMWAYTVSCELASEASAYATPPIPLPLDR